MLHLRCPVMFTLLLLTLGCSGSSGADAGPADARVPDAAMDASGALDGAMLDGSLDAGVDASADADQDASADAARADASLDAGAAAGFGSVLGPCGRVAPELSDATPIALRTHLDFMMDGYDDPAERGMLTPGGQRILMEGTAGGSSGVSEAFAYEVLARCEGASLLKTETQIVYDVMGKITDILVSIDGERVGVSVTRAVSFPPEASYTTADAAFIERKLNDILESSMNVSAGDAWVKQILLVMAYDDAHADVVRAVWEGLPATTQADTILYLVVTDGDDNPIYF